MWKSFNAGDKVGYHINLEIWSGKEPYLREIKNEQIGNRR